MGRLTCRRLARLPLALSGCALILYGSLEGIDRTIKILHAFGYADSNDWRDPIPVPATETTPRSSSGVETWMVMMTKTLLLE